MSGVDHMFSLESPPASPRSLQPSTSGDLRAQKSPVMLTSPRLHSGRGGMPVVGSNLSSTTPLPISPRSSSLVFPDGAGPLSASGSNTSLNRKDRLAEAELESLQVQLVLANAQIAENQRKHEIALRQKDAEAAEKEKRYKGELAAFQTELEHAIDSSLEIQRKLDAATAKHTEELSSFIETQSRLETELASLKAKSQTTNAEMEVLNLEREQANLEAQRKFTQAAKAQEEEHKRKLDALIKREVKLQAELSEMAAKLETAERNLKEVTNREEQVQGEWQRTVASLTKSNNQIKALNAEKDELLKMNTELTDSVEAMKSEHDAIVADLTQKLQEQELAATRAQAQIAEMTASHEDQMTELQLKYEETFASLQAKNDELEITKVKVAQMQKNNEALSKERDSAIAQKEQIIKDVARTQAALAISERASLQAVMTERDDLRKQVSALQLEIAKYDLKLTAMTDERDNWERKYSDMAEAQHKTPSKAAAPADKKTTAAKTPSKSTATTLKAPLAVNTSAASHTLTRPKSNSTAVSPGKSQTVKLTRRTSQPMATSENFKRLANATSLADYGDEHSDGQKTPSPRPPEPVARVQSAAVHSTAAVSTTATAAASHHSATHIKTVDKPSAPAINALLSAAAESKRKALGEGASAEATPGAPSVVSQETTSLLAASRIRRASMGDSHEEEERAKEQARIQREQDEKARVESEKKNKERMERASALIQQAQKLRPSSSLDLGGSAPLSPPAAAGEPDASPPSATSPPASRLGLKPPSGSPTSAAGVTSPTANTAPVLAKPTGLVAPGSIAKPSGLHAPSGLHPPTASAASGSGLAAPSGLHPPSRLSAPTAGAASSIAAPPSPGAASTASSSGLPPKPTRSASQEKNLLASPGSVSTISSSSLSSVASSVPTTPSPPATSAVISPGASTAPKSKLVAPGGGLKPPSASPETASPTPVPAVTSPPAAAAAAPAVSKLPAPKPRFGLKPPSAVTPV